jgi:hypothetical protein
MGPGIGERLRRLWSKAAVPGLLVLAWKLSGHASTADFLRQIWINTSSWRDAHLSAQSPVWWFVGFGWLGILIVWPEAHKWLRANLPKLFPAKGPSLPERVQELERHLAPVKQIKPGERIPELYKRTLILAGVVQAIGSFGSWLSDITILIAEATEAEWMFGKIQARYPQSDVALKPFSIDWRLKIGSDPAEGSARAGQAWLDGLHLHMRRCQKFEDDYRRQILNDSSVQLQSCVNLGSPDISAQECIRLLSEHLRDLEHLRDRRTADLGDPTLGFRDISQS